MSGLRHYDLFIDGRKMKTKLPEEFALEGHVFIHFNHSDVFLGCMDHDSADVQGENKKYLKKKDLLRVRGETLETPVRNAILELALDSTGTKVYVSSHSPVLRWGLQDQGKSKFPSTAAAVKSESESDSDSVSEFSFASRRPYAVAATPGGVPLEFGVTYEFEDDYTEEEVASAKRTNTPMWERSVLVMVTAPEMRAGPDVDDIGRMSDSDDPPDRHRDWDSSAEMPEMQVMRAQLQLL